MGDKTLRRNLLRYNFESQIHDVIDMQKFISANIYNLLRGSRETREDFHYLQKVFCRTLRVSIGEIRECMDLVSIDELEGFDVVPITRCTFNEDNDDSDEDEDEDDTGAEAALSSSEPEKRYPTDEEIMAYMGSLTVEQLVAFCNTSTPPDDQEEAHDAQPKVAEKQYDDNGFYIEELGEEEPGVEDEYDDGAPLTRMKPRIQSWADEVEDATKDGTMLAPDAQSPADSVSSSSSSSSFVSDPDASRRGRPSQRKPKPQPPLSNELRAVLECLNGDPNVRRSKNEVRLSGDEVFEAGQAWDSKVEEMKRREGGAARGRGRGRGPPRGGESWEEADLLDGWDRENGQYYWQTEGLFLCRLAQVLYKDRFASARKIYWRMNVFARQNKTAPKKKSRASRGRNRVAV